MADESEVEDALCDFIVATLYPGGTEGLDASAPSLAGAPAKVQRGMPLSLDLEAMIRDGVIDIAVAARNGVERVTTRYSRKWEMLIPPVHTITVTPPSQTITLGGTVSVPQNVALGWGPHAHTIHAVQAGESLQDIAAALAAALVAQGAPVVASGTSLTVASGPDLRARVGGFGAMARELKRQDKSFQITIFTPTPELRDDVAKIIDPALANINFLTLPDRTRGLVRYERTIVIDTYEKMTEYRRDLFFWVEYPTITTMQAPEVIAIGSTSGSDDTPRPQRFFP